jgi:sigma-E factor negative regulatory protein RseC
LATEQGMVITTHGGTAVVKTKKSEACAGCSSQNSCNSKGNDMEVSVVNDIGAKKGDDVILRIQTAPFLKATFMLYLFPILFMMGGAFLGERLALRFDFDESVLSAILAFSFLFISILIVKAKGKEMGENEAYHPKIIRIIKRLVTETAISEKP